MIAGFHPIDRHRVLETSLLECLAKLNHVPVNRRGDCLQITFNRVWIGYRHYLESFRELVSRESAYALCTCKTALVQRGAAVTDFFDTRCDPQESVFKNLGVHANSIIRN